MEVLLVIEVEGLEDKDVFEKHLKKEGFEPVEDEAFAYHGQTTTSLMNTETFILHVTKEALKQAGFFTCKVIFQVGKNPMKAFVLDKKEKDFTQVQSPQE
jgi:hypothetical protein